VILELVVVVLELVVVGTVTVVGGASVVGTGAMVVLGAEGAATAAAGVEIVVSGMASEVWVLVTSCDAPPHAPSARSRATSRGFPDRLPTLIAASSPPYRNE
jgi:hypothetical protein